MPYGRLNLVKFWTTLAVAAIVPLFLIVQPVSAKLAVNVCIERTAACYNTINDALSAAENSDVLQVKAGTYSEAVQINKEITLISEGGADSTTIAAPSGNPTIYIESGNVKIEGFTLTADDDQAGIFGYLGGSPLNNLTITGNKIDGTGMGFFFDALTNSTIQGNVLTNINGYGLIMNHTGGTGITVKGNTISNIIGDNCAIALIYDTSSTVEANTISDSFCGIIVAGNPPPSGGGSAVVANNNTVKNNTLSNGTYGIFLSWTENTTITGNTASGYDNNISVQNSTNDLIKYNTIQNGDIGVLVSSGVNGLKVNLNKIQGNTTSGADASGANSAVDFVQNWWGAANGPAPTGSGNAVTDKVNFTPYLTKAEYATADPLVVTADQFQDLGQSGFLQVPGGASLTDTPSITVTKEINLIVPTTGGQNMQITLPEGTVITKTDGGNINTNQLTAGVIDTGSVKGFSTGTSVYGVLQWGIPSLGLSFSQPITIKIFIGTDLNGRTLAIFRSTTSDSGWTSDGIVSPATCVVTDGFCTFQATQASYYAATNLPSEAAGTLPQTGAELSFLPTILGSLIVIAFKKIAL